MLLDPTVAEGAKAVPAAVLVQPGAENPATPAVVFQRMAPAEAKERPLS